MPREPDEHHFDGSRDTSHTSELALLAPKRAPQQAERLDNNAISAHSFAFGLKPPESLTRGSAPTKCLTQVASYGCDVMGAQ